MNRYLQPQLSGGLCNKLFCLFSACDIAIKNNVSIVDPIFGWTKKILFSDIYDIDFFNESMKQYFNGSNILIKNEDIEPNSQIIRLDWLWEYSENILKHQRENGTMEKDCMNIAVLKALKINKKYEYIIDIFGKQELGIHIRIEQDWVNHIKDNTSFPENESKLITLEKLTDMIIDSKEFINVKTIFFSCGEQQENIINEFKNKNLNALYFFRTEYEYELNAAINFEILVNSNYFIGFTRSTFSNLISCKRGIINKNNTFIYNYSNKITERIDIGLQPIAINSISKKTELV
jgi:hypothetical protein